MQTSLEDLISNIIPDHLSNEITEKPTANEEQEDLIMQGVENQLFEASNNNSEQQQTQQSNFENEHQEEEQQQQSSASAPILAEKPDVEMREEFLISSEAQEQGKASLLERDSNFEENAHDAGKAFEQLQLGEEQGNKPSGASLSEGAAGSVNNNSCNNANCNNINSNSVSSYCNSNQLTSKSRIIFTTTASTTTQNSAAAAGNASINKQSAKEISNSSINNNNNNNNSTSNNNNNNPNSEANNNKSNSEKPIEEEEYFVEKILRKRTTPDLRYFVKWVGWEEKYSTWEPLEHLLNVTQLIDEFEKNEAIKIQRKIDREYYKSPDFPQSNPKSTKMRTSSEEDDEDYQINEEQAEGFALANAYESSNSDESFGKKNHRSKNSKRGGRGRRNFQGAARRHWKTNFSNEKKTGIFDLNNSLEDESFLKRTTEEGENEYNNCDSAAQKLFRKDSAEKQEIIRKIKPKEFKEKLLHKLDEDEICYNISNILDAVMKNGKNTDSDDASFEEVLKGPRPGRKKKRCEFIDDGTVATAQRKRGRPPKSAYGNNHANRKINEFYPAAAAAAKREFSSISYYRNLEHNISENDNNNDDYNYSGKKRIKDIQGDKNNFYDDNDESGEDNFSGVNARNYAYNKRMRNNNDYDDNYNYNNYNQENYLNKKNKNSLLQNKRNLSSGKPYATTAAEYDKETEQAQENDGKEKVDGFVVLSEIPHGDIAECVLNVKRIGDDLYCLVKFLERSTGVLPDDAFVPGDLITLRFPEKLIDFYESKIVFK